MKKSKMFMMAGQRIETWNPVVWLCSHACKYCWATDYILTRLRDSKKWQSATVEPKIYESALKERLKKVRFRFPCDMIDLFADPVPTELITRVLRRINEIQETQFILLTKNPKRYDEFMLDMPPNVILGATIECPTYKEEWGKISNAPDPSQRIAVMKTLKNQFPFHQRMVSIEPVLNFDSAKKFALQIADIEPMYVYVGLDTVLYERGQILPEPSKDDFRELILRLADFTFVNIKERRDWI